jgi:hypothetical protein
LGPLWGYLILQKWGQRNYNPEPKDIVNFDVIDQLLKALRQWPSQVRLVKIKSHTGCLLNERSDEQVEIGYSTEDPNSFPGPQKFASLSIRARSQLRTSARECKISIPRDSAPNHTHTHTHTLALLPQKGNIKAGFLRRGGMHCIQSRMSIFARSLRSVWGEHFNSFSYFLHGYLAQLSTRLLSENLTENLAALFLSLSLSCSLIFV